MGIAGAGNFCGVLLAGKLGGGAAQLGAALPTLRGGGRSQPLTAKRLQDSHQLQVRSKYCQDCFSKSFGVMAVRNALCLLVGLLVFGFVFVFSLLFCG